MKSGFRSESGIPVETYQAARKVFNIQHIYIRIGDHLESLKTSCNLAVLDPTSALNSDTVFRLALVTAFQYAEALPDPIASDAILKRMDWKYALYLPVNYPGISEMALCKFRQNLHTNQKGLDEYARLFQSLGKLGLFSREAGQKSNLPDALATICQFTRYFYVKQSMKITLGVLTSAAPEWMRQNALPHWYERYKTGKLNLPTPVDLPQEAAVLGSDIQQLLAALERTKSPHINELAELPEVKALAGLFHEQYSQEGEAIRWLSPDCVVCSMCHN